MNKLSGMLLPAMVLCVHIRCTGSPILPPTAYMVNDHNRNFILPKFSAYPPEGENWSYSIRFKDSLFFQSINQRSDKSIRIEILKVTSPVKNKDDFFQFARHSIRRDDSSENLKIVKDVFEECGRYGDYCARYIRKGEMHNVSIKGIRTDLIIEDEGYIFCFSDSPTICYDINSYESYKAGDKDPLFGTVFDRFLLKVVLFH